MVLLFSLLVALLVLQLCSSCDKYCAQIDASIAGGANGFVALSIGKGRAVYDLALDLTQFDTDCDLTQGLKYHVHSFWNNKTSESSINGYCGAAITGGHYDPNFACSSSSQSISSDCIALSRVAPTYIYNCTKSNYNLGKYSMCELGDISGKNGVLYPDSSSSVFKLSCPFVDILPLYAVNYNSSDTNSLPWTSVVFHCASTNARLVCAKFSKSDISACDASFAQPDHCGEIHHHNDAKGTVYPGQFNVAVSVSVVLCLLAGILFGTMICRYSGRARSKSPSYEVLDFDA